jgi:hypothetical protein
MMLGKARFLNQLVDEGYGLNNLAHRRLGRNIRSAVRWKFDNLAALDRKRVTYSIFEPLCIIL